MANIQHADITYAHMHNAVITKRGTAAPTDAPMGAGDLYLDTSAGVLYYAIGTLVSDWVRLNAKNNLTAGGPPSTTNDSTQGYSRLSIWFDQSASPVDIYMCIDPAEGAAVWILISGGGSGSGADPDLTYLTVSDETATLPNSVQVNTHLSDGSVPVYQVGNTASADATLYRDAGGDGTVPTNSLVIQMEQSDFRIREMMGSFYRLLLQEIDTPDRRLEWGNNAYAGMYLKYHKPDSDPGGHTGATLKLGGTSNAIASARSLSKLDTTVGEGYDGVEYTVARIEVFSSEAHVFGTEHGSEIAFYVVPNNDDAIVEKLRLRNDGTLDILSGLMRLPATTAPSSETDTATAGDIRRDENYLYFATATNFWKKVPLSAFSDSGGGSGFIVGEFKDGPWATAPSGWVLCDGKTIGSAASGATGRANADTADLFAVLWAEYANAQLPIQDSSGSASTRGANAAADFAANKRMPLPDYRGRFPLYQDDMGGTSANRVTSSEADLMGGSSGAETHTLVTGEIPSHTHTTNSHYNGGSAATVANSGGSAGAGTIASNSTGGGGAHNNMPPYLVSNRFMKL